MYPGENKATRSRRERETEMRKKGKTKKGLRQSQTDYPAPRGDGPKCHARPINLGETKTLRRPNRTLLPPTGTHNHSYN